MNSSHRSWLSKYGKLRFVIIAFYLSSALLTNAQVLTFEQAKRRADAGDHFAQAVVALHYQLGWNTQKNSNGAVNYAIASADAGHPLGLFRLGSLLRAGEGTTRDEQKGLALQSTSFNALKNAQDPYSITSVAIMIFQGKVVGQNVSEEARRRDAAALYKKAADMGYAPAQFNYAMAANDGHGVSKDPALFKQYLTKAREASYPLAVSFVEKQDVFESPSLVNILNEPAAEARAIEHLIESGNLQNAHRLAEQWLAACENSNRGKLAEANYYVGVLYFLAGNRDGDAERLLNKALWYYRKMSPADPIGHSRTHYIIKKIYFDRSERPPYPPKLLEKLLDDEWVHLDKATRLACIGLPPQAKGTEIYTALCQNSDLKSKDSDLRRIISRLEGDSVHGVEIMNDQRGYEKNRDSELENLDFERDFTLPRSRYYTDGLQKLRNAKAESLAQALQIVQLRLDALSNIENQISLSNRSKKTSDSIVGFTGSGQRWAYEFIDQENEPTLNLRTDSAGSIIFTDSNFVVRAVTLSVAAGNGLTSIKTELSFYDTRSERLLALVCVPNRVFKVGYIGQDENGQFYAGTITPQKYRYDDHPMALVLIDVPRQTIERLPLISDDYWLALEHDVEIENDLDTIKLTVDKGLSSKYLVRQPSKQPFGKLKLSISERIKSVDQLPDGNKQPPVTESITVKNPIISEDIAGLSYLGQKALRETIPEISRGQFAVGPQVIRDTNFLLVRATKDGGLMRFSPNSLKATFEKLSRNGAYAPFVFEDGTVACVVDGKLEVFSNKKVKRFEIPEPDNDVLINTVNSMGLYRLNCGKLMFSSSAVGYANDSGTKFYRLRPREDESFSAVFPNEKILSRLASSQNGEVILDWDLSTETFVVGGYVGENQPPRHLRIEEKSGRSVGNRWDGGGRNIYAGINYSQPSGGWRAFSFINDATTGGETSCVMLEKDGDGSSGILIADSLAGNAEPLAICTQGSNATVVFGAGNNIQLVRVDLIKSKCQIIRIWNYPGRFGKALCDQNTGTLLIPSASGFDVWSIWNEKPTKHYELVIGESDQFAVLLPNGTYAGSPGCESLIRLKAGDGTVDASSVAQWRNRPAEVLKFLGGDYERVDVLAKVTARWQKRMGFDPSKPEPKASDLPKVSVPARPPLWATRESTEFTIEWREGASPLRRVIVRVNGVESASFEGDALQATNGDKGSVDATIKLAEGQNWIEVTAEDIDGHRSDLQRFRTILKDSPVEKKRYIVAIGVSEYAKPELNLKFAAKDAKDFLEALAGKGAAETGLIAEMSGQSAKAQGSDKVLLLTNDQVDGSAVEKILEFVGKSSESDDVILFCAGHGILDDKLDYYYAGHDFDPERPAETGIKLDDLVGAVSSAKALKRLILLDTCHAGVVGEKDEMLLAQRNTELPLGVRAVAQRGLKVKPAADFSDSDKQLFIEEMFSLPGTIRGVNIIGASAGAQFALESDEWNNGVFTASVIEGLRDKKADLNEDGRITVSELKNYIGLRVSELTAGAQKPSVVAFEQDQDFDLLRRK